MRSQKDYAEQLNLSDFSDKSLLILDDDDPLRGRLSRAMEKKGFTVKEAKSVAEGLQIAKNSPPGFALARPEVRWHKCRYGIVTPLLPLMGTDY